MEANFPRGGRPRRRSSAEAESDDKKRRVGRDHHKKRSSSDLLFGSSSAAGDASPTSSPLKRAKRADTTSSKKSTISSTSSSKTTTTSTTTGAAAIHHSHPHQSMLPVGGGGVKTLQKTNQHVIEALSWTKLSRGMTLLGCVREVYSDFVVFSLPNLWTGYMLASSGQNNEDLTKCVSVGQYMSVIITKAVQETTKDGPRRRIQVNCRPSAINPSDIAESTGILRGQVISVEDHGLLIDLGWNRRGFLPLDKIDGKYSLSSDNNNNDDDDDDDDENENMSDEEDGDQQEPRRCLAPGRIIDVVVVNKGGNNADTPIIPLKLPSCLKMTTEITPTFNNLSSVQPGLLVRCQIDALLTNGLAVTFGNNGVYRGSIELSHIGGYLTSSDVDDDKKKKIINDTTTTKNTTTAAQPWWKRVFKLHMYLTARILAVDPSTRIVRLTLQPHLLALSLQQKPVSHSLPVVGTVIPKAVVVRLDPGVGALLALPPSQQQEQQEEEHGDEDDDDDDDNDDDGEDDDDDDNDSDEKENNDGGKRRTVVVASNNNNEWGGGDEAKATIIARQLNGDLWRNDSYQRAAQTRAVYVHISKAMDDNDDSDNIGDNKKKKKKKTKKIAASSATGNNNNKLDPAVFARQFSENSTHDVRILSTTTLEGIATGSTATSVVTAHVLTHADLKPGAIYKQVPVVAHVQSKNNNNFDGRSSSTSFSVLVHLGMGVRGLIPAVHLFDSTSASSEYRDKVAKSMYAVGNKVNVTRVLYVNEKEKRCVLTAKKSLTKTQDVITSYDKVQVGQKATGFITKVDKRQGIFVTFFNGVYGRVTAKSLLIELGMTVEESNYQIGDVVECRVINIKKKKSRRNKRHGYDNSDDDDDDDDDEGLETANSSSHHSYPSRCYWELTLSLRTTNTDDDGDEHTSPSSTPPSTAIAANSSNPVLHIKPGGILPLRSIRIVELVGGRYKQDGTTTGSSFIPGYALVSIKSKYLLNNATTGYGSIKPLLPPYIDCKLPYDQILDEYDETDIQSASALDDLVSSKLLTVGKKINRKGVVLTDPAKLLSEYTSGTGKLTVISIKPQLVEIAEMQQHQENLKNDNDAIILPTPDSHLYIGAHLIGYVVQLHPRYGAFIRFLSGLTGLVPKLQGGLDLKLFHTVQTRVVALDVTCRPMKILLTTHGGANNSINNGQSNKNTIDDGIVKAADITATTGITSPIQKGDLISEVEIIDIDFHRCTVRILDENMIKHGIINNKYRARLHCTMADSKPLKEPIDAAVETPNSATAGLQAITTYHPFYGLTVGTMLSKLRVAAKDIREDTIYLDLTSRHVDTVVEAEAATALTTTNGGHILFVEHASDLKPGQKVTGIITSIDLQRARLWLQVCPGVSGYIPALELSDDANILNNLSQHFVVGCRLECIVIEPHHHDKWRNKTHNNNKKKQSRKEDPLILSYLQSHCSGSKPQRGDLIVGRISSHLKAMLPPALMLELRGGFIGRCCICELDDPDEWVNMPLQQLNNKLKAETDKNQPNEHIYEEDSIINENNNSRMEVDDDGPTPKPYSHGRFVNCRVLDVITSKHVLDVSLRNSRIEGDLDDDEPPLEVDEIVHAYVATTNKKGCFLRLARKVEGRAILKELCDGFLPNPAASFPAGRLVVGRIKAVKDHKTKNQKSAPFTFTKVVDLDMRESVLLDAAEKQLSFKDIKIGQKYRGTVGRIEEYGVFVRLHNSNVSGLVHKSECSDRYINKKLSDLYDPGDLVKILVLKKDDEKKQLGFSMKASHFERDEDSDDDSSMDGLSDNEEDGVDPERKHPKEHGVDGMDSDDENLVSKLAVELHGDDMERKGGSSSSSSSSSGSSSEESEAESGSDEASSDHGMEDDDSIDRADSKKGDSLMDTDVGFDWGGLPSVGSGNIKQHSDEDESSSSSEEDNDGDNRPLHKTTSHKSRRKQAQHLREEQEIARREADLADGTVDKNPETTADFERLLAVSPDSSELWIKYMAFHLSLADVEAAKAVAERAFKRISFRQEGDRLNVWCALLTLELKYGTEEELLNAIDRACQHNNPKHVYLRVCEMLEKEYSDSKTPESLVFLDNFFSKMCKKFKDKKRVWIAHIEYLLKSNRHDDAHAMSKRALQSLPMYKHIETMTKVAQLVFEYGSPEKARTLFDGLLLKYPKRLDLFFVYIDKEVKHGDLEVARGLFERQVAPEETIKLKLSDKQMKSFFKKWYSFEEQNGTGETQERVKHAARAYVEQTMS